MTTLGEYRVGIINPGGNEMVDKIKRAAADLIDLIASIDVSTDDSFHDGEVQRLRAVALTHIEDGAMWAVKAATKPRR